MNAKRSPNPGAGLTLGDIMRLGDVQVRQRANMSEADRNQQTDVAELLRPWSALCTGPFQRLKVLAADGSPAFATVDARPPTWMRAALKDAITRSFAIQHEHVASAHDRFAGVSVDALTERVLEADPITPEGRPRRIDLWHCWILMVSRHPLTAAFRAEHLQSVNPDTDLSSMPSGIGSVHANGHEQTLNVFNHLGNGDPVTAQIMEGTMLWLRRIAASLMAHEDASVSLEHSIKSSSKMRSVRRTVPWKVGRNDLCPCGSGKKFKKCCERK